MSRVSPLHIAIIIVSYNTKGLLRECLRSVVAAQANAPHVKIITVVVDNGSVDGSPNMVRMEFPEVLLVPLSQNTGFTGGNNLALNLLGFAVDTVTEPAATPDIPNLEQCSRDCLSESPPDYVLLLNSDAALTDHALANMVDVMLTHPNAGICGPQLRYPDERFQHSAFRYPGLAQVLIDLFPLPWLPGWRHLEGSRLNGRYSVNCWTSGLPFRVDFVLGAALLIRRATIEQIGGLDPDYFMYCEEMDWCLRARLAGWQTYAVPGARVIHHEGQSSKQARWSSYARLWRSRLRFYRKHRQLFSSMRSSLLIAAIDIGMAILCFATRQAFRKSQISGVEAKERLNAYTSIRLACRKPASLTSNVPLPSVCAIKPPTLDLQ